MVVMSSLPKALPQVDQVSSPALLIYPDRVRDNIRIMLEIAGDADRLRPHVKTYKLAEMVRMQMKAGIGKFKCATLAEAEMLGKENAADILLAIQPVGPEITRYAQLAKAFPEALFSVVVDDAEIIRQLNRSCAEESIRLGAFLDINVGMNRTGVLPGPEAIARYKLLHEMPFPGCPRPARLRWAHFWIGSGCADKTGRQSIRAGPGTDFQAGAIWFFFRLKLSLEVLHPFPFMPGGRVWS